MKSLDCKSTCNVAYNYQTDVNYRLAEPRDHIYIRTFLNGISIDNNNEKHMKSLFYHTPENWLRFCDSTKSKVMIVEIIGTSQIIGLAIFNNDHYNPHFINISYLVCDVIYRRTKLGSILIQRVLEYVYTHGIYSAYKMIIAIERSKHGVEKFLRYNLFNLDSIFDNGDSKFKIFTRDFS